MNKLFEKTNFSETKFLFLMLGSACNMQCRHCIQTPVKTTKTAVMSDKVLQLVENFIAFAIKNPYSDGKPRKIYFYGGEPLLHWKFIKDLVIKMTNKYHLLENRTIVFDMITNGLLLTEDIISFCNKYPLLFSLSFDAPHPFAVRGFISEEKLLLLQKVRKYYVLSTVSAKNTDILLAYRCLRAKFPTASDIVIGYGLTQSFVMPTDIYAYNWEEIKCNIRKLRVAAQFDDVFAITCLQEKFLKKLIICNHMFHKDYEYFCVTRGKNLSVSLDGTVYACYNSDICLGTVSDDWETLLKRACNVSKDKKPLGCVLCRHKDICDSHCMLDMQTECRCFVSCKNFFIPFYDIIKSELKMLSVPLSNEDKKWFIEQEKSMNVQVQNFVAGNYDTI